MGGIERRMNWAERETENGRQKVGKGRRGRSEEQKGEGGIYGRRESSTAPVHARSRSGGR